PEGRWVNGSIGRVIDFDAQQNTVIVRLNSGLTVNVTRFSWDLYKFYYDEDLRQIVSEVTGSFKQLPLRLAWAVTIHKSQGQTFQSVVIDLGAGTFTPGQLYVALSRCTSLKGLKLNTKIMPRHIQIDQRILAFYKSRNLES
ncbi:MAG: ATP-binding domain-containing protein, partial [Acidobacteria bacterium]|nr:ATP-binding domain-containing protein [Acidobacteriota bacterium]